MYQSRFAFKNSGISCLALIFDLSNPRTTILHAKIGFRLQDVFSVNRYELTAQWPRQVVVCRATWVRFLQVAETLCRPSAFLRGIEPVSAPTRALLYCCTLS